MNKEPTTSAAHPVAPVKLSPDVEADVRAGVEQAIRGDFADLTPEERAAAPAVFRALLAGQLLHGLGEKRPAKILKAVRLALEMEPILSIEALDLVEAGTLRPVERIEGPVVLFAAAWAGKTLLADSVRFGPG